MDEVTYDEFLCATWQALKKEQIDWIEWGKDEDDQEDHDGTGPSFGKVGLIRQLHEQKGLGLREAHAVVTDYLRRHPDPDYEEWSLRQREAVQQINAQLVQVQEASRKWWQFWR